MIDNIIIHANKNVHKFILQLYDDESKTMCDINVHIMTN